jgi:hypothetical protein
MSAMLGFLLRKKREELRKLLSRYMNEDYALGTRGAFTRSVWVVPYDDIKNPRFEEAFPVVTRDIGPEGLSLIGNSPLQVDRMLIGLGKTERLEFVSCTREHSTSIGLGFHLAGVHAHEVVQISPDQVRRLQQRAAELTLGIDAHVPAGAY